MSPLPSIDPVLLPTDDERCVGLMYGPDLSAPPLPATTKSPREAIEAVVLEALLAGPCAVMFSGGRDSSVILAIAVHVARREGLPLPVPITQRYPSAPDSIEDDWQATVIDHLGIEEWLRVDCTGQHEMFGAKAREALVRRGVMLPPLWWTNTLPAEFGGVDPAIGEGERPIVGSVLTGLGGDEVFPGPSRPWLAAVRAGRRPALRRAHHLAVEGAPRAVRERLEARRHLQEELVWIRPAARRRIAVLAGRERAGEPVRYDRMIQRLWVDRDLRGVRAGIEIGTRESGGRLVTPFCDPTVMAALAFRWQAAHPLSRFRGLQDLAGDLLPEEILRRTSKANYGAAFFGEESEAWVRAWDGSGVDEERVDGVALRAMLLDRRLDARAVPSAQLALLRQPTAAVKPAPTPPQPA